QAADRVLGQPDFVSHTWSTTASATDMTTPRGIVSVGSKLYVVSTGDSRVMLYDCSFVATASPTPSISPTSTPTRTGSPAVSLSLTPTMTPSVTGAATVTQVASPGSSPTETPTVTPSVTA